MKKNMDLTKVGQLYTDNIKKYGIDPKSVGWTKQGLQQMQFEKLLLLIEKPQDAFSLNELGCGYGELYKYCLDKHFNVTKFFGYDISKKMLDAANKYIGRENVFLYEKSKLDIEADYSVTSGIFNVRFDHSSESWEDYIKETLLNMNTFSRKGFSFNMLTKYVDFENDNLYYGDPLFFFDFCKRNISKKVNLIHDYDSFEWTIIVKK